MQLILKGSWSEILDQIGDIISQEGGEAGAASTTEEKPKRSRGRPRNQAPPAVAGTATQHQASGLLSGPPAPPPAGGGLMAGAPPPPPPPPAPLALVPQQAPPAPPPVIPTLDDLTASLKAYMIAYQPEAGIRLLAQYSATKASEVAPEQRTNFINACRTPPGAAPGAGLLG